MSKKRRQPENADKVEAKDEVVSRDAATPLTRFKSLAKRLARVSHGELVAEQRKFEAEKPKRKDTT